MSVAGFKLTLWIPVEQVGIVIGRSGQTINKIQGGTSSRLNVVQDQDASAWAPVYIRGASYVDRSPGRRVLVRHDV